MSTPFYITTPIYYVNDRPHIGHCYTTTVADVAARFARLLGRDTFFLTGTDEHAEKVVKTAAEHGLSPQEWADINAAAFKKAFGLMSIDSDDFMRTSEDRHKIRAGALIAQLMESGDIYLGDYKGWYDPSQEEYLTETVAKEAGYTSPVTGKPLEERSEKNYFFRLSKYEDALHDAIDKGTKDEPGGYRILPDARRNEVLGRLKQGLRDVPVSRAVKDGWHGSPNRDLADAQDPRLGEPGHQADAQDPRLGEPGHQADAQGSRLGDSGHQADAQGSRLGDSGHQADAQGSRLGDSGHQADAQGSRLGDSGHQADAQDSRLGEPGHQEGHQELGNPDWGILMPGDAGHRVYVWIEALCNYMTAVENEMEPSTVDAEGLRKKYWPATVHVMAKDILWFHAVVWPAMLLALKKPLPGTIYAHAYFVAEGVKMSKSLGNFIEIDQLEAYSTWIVEAEKKQAQKESRDARPMGIDPVRWYLATQGPLGANDADFSHAKFVEVYNADLANGIGNCASRVGNMIAKYFDGVMPEEIHNSQFTATKSSTGDRETLIDIALRARERAGNPVEVGKSDQRYDFQRRIISVFMADALRTFDQFELDAVLRSGIRLIEYVDEFISYTAPFTLAKQLDKESRGKESLGAILYASAEAVRIASLLLYPALPNKMAELWRSWGCGHLVDSADPNSGFVAPLSELARWGSDHSLKAGQRIEKGPALFMRASLTEPRP